MSRKSKKALKQRRKKLRVAAHALPQETASSPVLPDEPVSIGIMADDGEGARWAACIGAHAGFGTAAPTERMSKKELLELSRNSTMFGFMHMRSVPDGRAFDLLLDRDGVDALRKFLKRLAQQMDEGAKMLAKASPESVKVEGLGQKPDVSLAPSSGTVH